jgi:arginase
VNTLPFHWVDVPIDCVGKSGGTELSPLVLREAGLPSALGIKHFLSLPVRINDPRRDPKSGVVGFKSVCETTKIIRQEVKSILANGHRPFLVGGCCTEAIGALAGARDHFGNVGLVNVDGHIDLYDGVSSPTGEAADIPVAVLLGYGPQGFTEFIGPMPPLSSAHLALVGYRDLDDARSRKSLLPQDVKAQIYEDVDAVRRASPDVVGRCVGETLGKNPGKFWIHLDFDVLDELVFPATDYLMPGGMIWEELVSLLKPLVKNPGLIGMSIACYNPEKDPQRECAKQIVHHLGVIWSSN